MMIEVRVTIVWRIVFVPGIRLLLIQYTGLNTLKVTIRETTNFFPALNHLVFLSWFDLSDLMRLGTHFFLRF